MSTDDKDFAGFQTSTTAPRYQPADITDKMLGDEDTVQGGFPSLGRMPEPQYQPVNQATMECLRGPCRHLWTLMSRLGDTTIGDEIQLKNVRQCNCHYEPTELGEENIYRCDQWWPGTLSWVPESLRYALRTRLRRAWEWYLKRIGYDFNWRTWPDDVFEADDPTRRKNAKPGAPSGASVREKIRRTKDGIEFGG